MSPLTLTHSFFFLPRRVVRAQDLEAQLAELAEALRRRNPDCIANLIRAARPTMSQEMQRDGALITQHVYVLIWRLGSPRPGRERRRGVVEGKWKQKRRHFSDGTNVSLALVKRCGLSEKQRKVWKDDRELSEITLLLHVQLRVLQFWVVDSNPPPPPTHTPNFTCPTPRRSWRFCRVRKENRRARGRVGTPKDGKRAEA